MCALSAALSAADWHHDQNANAFPEAMMGVWKPKLGLILLLWVCASALDLFLDVDPALFVPSGHDIDDDLALLFAMALEPAGKVRLRGVSITAGNAALAHTTADARFLLRHVLRLPEPFNRLTAARRRVSGPAWSARASAASDSPDSPLVAGTDATDGLQLAVGPAAAAELLARTARALPPRTLAVLALGPATNVAGALAQHEPWLARRLRCVVLMGGELGSPDPLPSPAALRWLLPFPRARRMLRDWLHADAELNMLADTAAFGALLRAAVPTVVVPTLTARQVRLHTAALLPDVAECAADAARNGHSVGSGHGPGVTKGGNGTLFFCLPDVRKRVADHARTSSSTIYPILLQGRADAASFAAALGPHYADAAETMSSEHGGADSGVGDVGNGGGAQSNYFVPWDLVALATLTHTAHFSGGLALRTQLRGRRLHTEPLTQLRNWTAAMDRLARDNPEAWQGVAAIPLVVSGRPLAREILAALRGVRVTGTEGSVPRFVESPEFIGALWPPSHWSVSTETLLSLGAQCGSLLLGLYVLLLSPMPAAMIARFLLTIAVALWAAVALRGVRVVALRYCKADHRTKAKPE